MCMAPKAPKAPPPPPPPPPPPAAVQIRDPIADPAAADPSKNPKNRVSRSRLQIALGDTGSGGGSGLSLGQ